MCQKHLEAEKQYNTAFHFVSAVFDGGVTDWDHLTLFVVCCVRLCWLIWVNGTEGVADHKFGEISLGRRRNAQDVRKSNLIFIARKSVVLHISSLTVVVFIV